MRCPLFHAILCCLGLFSADVKGGDIAKLLEDGSFWEKPLSEMDEFSDVRGTFLQKQTFRTSGANGLKMAELTVGEAILSIDERKIPLSMTVMIYNKGDNGEVGKDEYGEYVASAIAALNGLTGVKGKARKINKRDAAVKLNAWQWVWEKGAARLEAASSGSGKTFQPEFVRLKIAADTGGLERGGAADVVGRSVLRKNVKTEDTRHWIDGIPMVDQGQKGYCVPATLSRLFAYYGMDGVDQHALAALCKSDGDGGTSCLQMEAALKKISSAFHIRLSKMDGPGLGSISAKNYNRMAKRLKKPPFPGAFNFFEMDGEVLSELYAGDSAQVSKWMSAVAKSIDAGVPIVWSVWLGLFPEQVSQTNGGHMRLIIGYDMENKEILYSDSWGNGHALKTMPAAQAVSITVFRYILRPTR